MADLYCLTILGYRRQGLSQKDYRDYRENKHPPLVAPLLAKHQVVQVHNIISVGKLVALY